MRFVASLVWACCACAGASPTSDCEMQQRTCVLLAVEQAPVTGDSDTDTLALVARYRFGERDNPVEALFQVRREREDEMRAHLEQHETVMCRPRRVEGSGCIPRDIEVEVPPFEPASPSMP